MNVKEEQVSTFEDLLARDGRLVYKTRGMSMEPMLRQNRDIVVINVPFSRLRKYDVALYRRGSGYVLHRVIEVGENEYLIRGDNTYVLETVPDSAVIGVLTAFRRNGKQHEVTEKGYQLYVRVWNTLYPLRLYCFRMVRLMKAVARKLGLTPLIKRLIRYE